MRVLIVVLAIIFVLILIERLFRRYLWPNTYLFHDCLKGDTTNVEQILKKKPSLANRKPSSYGQTLLHLLAGTSGHKPEVVGAIRLLIEYGANVNAKDRFGATPLHMAAIAGSVPAMEALITGGADVNARSNDGFTPLFHAVNRKEVADYLIENGASIDPRLTVLLQ
jgi:ankyrin repeat protein